MYFVVFSYSMRSLAGCKGVNDMVLSVVPAKATCGFGSRRQRWNRCYFPLLDFMTTDSDIARESYLQF